MLSILVNLFRQEIGCDYTLVNRSQSLLPGEPKCHIPVNNLEIAKTAGMKNGHRGSLNLRGQHRTETYASEPVSLSDMGFQVLNDGVFDLIFWIHFQHLVDYHQLRPFAASMS